MSYYLSICSNYDEYKELSYLSHSHVNNLYGLRMSQRFPFDGFKRVEESFQFNEHFTKSYNDDSNEGHFLGVDVQ